MKPRGPERLSDVLARLFVERGWGRKQERVRLEQVWVDAVGAEAAGQTRIAGFRRGILEVVVGNAVLLQELTHFHKRRLLQKLQQALSGMVLKDLRFRAGNVK